MPPKRTAPRRMAPPPMDWDVILPNLVDQLRAGRALKFTQITPLGVPKAEHGALGQRLRLLGYEVQKSLVRVPVLEQLRTLLAECRQVPLKGLEKRLAGCTGKDAKTAADTLQNSGAARRILRTKVEWLVTPDTDVLEPEQLKLLHRISGACFQQSAKALRSRKLPLTLWREDLRALLDEMAPLVHRASASPAHAEVSAGAANPHATVLEIIRNTLEGSVGLAFVPTVVERLGGTVEAGQARLLAAARAGIIELRPDGGGSRFSAEALQLAPPGPDGSRLLWVRPIGESV